MPRPRRAAEGGSIYHALNRANARSTIFDSDDDYAAFERVLALAVTRYDMRLLAYCLMPNHFDLALRPREDGDLSRFMGRLSMTGNLDAMGHFGVQSLQYWLQFRRVESHFLYGMPYDCKSKRRNLIFQHAIWGLA